MKQQHYNREDARKRAVSATYAQSRDPLAVERLKAHWAIYGHPCEDVRIAS